MTDHTAPRSQATLRSYRHGLGDCHLLTLTNPEQKQYRIMIDCGVIIGTRDAASTMKKVMQNIVEDTGGSIDLLVVTHRHWDHVSGFVQAAEEFRRLTIGEVWMAWSEDPEDSDAKALRGERSDALGLLRPVGARMHLVSGGEPNLLNSLLEFFGAAAGGTTEAAVDAARKAGAKLRYRDPKEPPTELAEFGARIYVLGPPRDPSYLKKMLPKLKDETYNLAMHAVESNIVGALAGADEEQPFTGNYRIPLAIARSTDFFQRRYWNDEEWRRIDGDWMGAATQLALALDNMINNTSLVLAIDLGEAGVLLFAADAQVGNWESWASYEWQADGKRVVAADLLARTVLYKVGHHGSYNATLRTNGLESMTQLKFAVIPVDHEMALVKRWGDIPLAALQSALERATGTRGCVLRTDQQPSQEAINRGLIVNSLYFELTLA